MTTAFAGGFLVDSSYIKVSNVPLGKNFELLATPANNPNSADTPGDQYFLKITNNKAESAKYTIELLTCKDSGYNPVAGYQDIPDLKWIKVENPTIEIPAHEKGYFRGVWIKIPKKKEYYNQRYQVIVKVKGVVNEGQSINVEVVLPLWVITIQKPPSVWGKLFGKKG